MPAEPRKRTLLDELVALLRAELAAAESLHRQTMAGATHEEARPENDKDTRALEQTYLARGQAQRVEQMRTELSEVLVTPLLGLGPGARVALGALVHVEEDGIAATLFIASGGGGKTLSGGVRVVTPNSPFGRSLIGKTAGDVCEIPLPQRTREISILTVA